MWEMLFPTSWFGALLFITGSAFTVYVYVKYFEYKNNYNPPQKPRRHRKVARAKVDTSFKTF